MTRIMSSRNKTNQLRGWSSARSLYRYIWRTSRSSQTVICLLIAVITPLPMVSLEFQRRIVDDAVGAGGLAGTLVQSEERGFGYAVEMAGVDDWHGHTVRRPIGWLSKPV